MRLIELYRFVMDSEVWTYTSGNESVEYNLETYTPVALGRSESEVKNELSKAKLDVKIDIQDPLAQRFLTTFTERVLTLTVYTQYQETVMTAVSWKGRLSNIRPGKDVLTMSFESVFTSLRRPGLRGRFQKTCRHVLYGRGCKLDPDDFDVPGQATSVNGNVVTVPQAAGEEDGYFTGGMLLDPTGLYAYIINHVGSTLTLQWPLDSLVNAANNSGYGNNYGNYYGGLNVVIYPGCDRLRGTCEVKFNNLDNYGGFPWIPSKNPMDGTSIV